MRPVQSDPSAWEWAREREREREQATESEREPILPMPRSLRILRVLLVEGKDL